MMGAKTRVLLVDDHPLIRAGFRNLLGDDCDVIGEVGTVQDALAFVQGHQTDLAIVDLVLPDGDGFSLTQQLLAAGLRVIVVSQYRDTQTVRKALAVGAHGYVPKTVDNSELLQAIATVARGEVWISPSIAPGLIDQLREPKPDVPQLTPRQLEVLQLIVEGRSTKDIATSLSLGIKTVETHRAQIMERLGIKNVAALVRYALENKLVK